MTKGSLTVLRESMDREYLDELRELIEFLRANAIAEFDMERSDVKLRIKFAGAAGPAGVEVIADAGDDGSDDDGGRGGGADACCG